jgi:hypothetical protein
VPYSETRHHGVGPFPGVLDFETSAVVEGQERSTPGLHGVTGEIGPVTGS